MPKLDHISHSIALPEGASASIAGDVITVSKDGQSLSREFRHHKVEVRAVNGDLEVFVNLPRRSDKALAGTWAAHLRNMALGIDEGFEYRLKAVFRHFPMSLKLDGKQMIINILFG